MTEPLVDSTLTRLDGRSVMRFTGEIDLSNTDQVENQVLAAAVTGAPVVLDLGGLTYLDSAGLHLLYRLTHGPAARNGLRMVAPVGCRARTVIDLAGVADGLAVLESVVLAMDDLDRQPGLDGAQ
jgi:anti-anti-sigma factor